LFNPLNWSFFPQFGLIKGFALTLAIGVGTSLFTGVFITKKLLRFKGIAVLMGQKKS
jgi:preprotein translocase subunit SecD